MKTQKKWFNELIALAEDNPELEIIFFVDSETLCEARYTKQDIERIEINDYYCDEDGWFVVGEDDIVAHFLNQFEDTETIEKDIVYLEARAVKEFEEKAKKAIFVYLSA